MDSKLLVCVFLNALEGQQKVCSLFKMYHLILVLVPVGLQQVEKSK